MNWQKQLEQQEAAFVRGVRAAVRFELRDIGIPVSDEGVNAAIRAVLLADGWSEKTAEHWIDKTME